MANKIFFYIERISLSIYYVFMDLEFFGGFYKKTDKSKIDFSNGIDHWLFIHFYQPMTINFNSIKFQSQSDACLICRPKTPLSFFSKKIPFEYDYFRIAINNEIFFEKYKLPINQVFYIKDSEAIKEPAQKITWLLTERASNNNQELEIAGKKAFEILSKNIMFSSPKTRRQNDIDLRLKQLRKEIQANPEKWTVDSMAETFSLTRCRFSVLYKQTFGAAPGNEKREFLNKKAQKLLASTKKSVQQIAAECGYNECENFIRAFRKSNGMSPLQFRKKHG